MPYDDQHYPATMPTQYVPQPAALITLTMNYVTCDTGLCQTGLTRRLAALKVRKHGYARPAAAHPTAVQRAKVKSRGPSTAASLTAPPKAAAAPAAGQVTSQHSTNYHPKLLFNLHG